MTIWTLSNDWFDRHTTQDLTYRVRVRALTPGALDAAWARIVEEHGADEDGVVPIGGAALIRVNDREAEAISGGEDALDSLEWAVNDVLGEALKGAEVLVVAEERALVTDAGDTERQIEVTEDRADIEAARVSRAEVEADGAVPWDEVKADLDIE
ncbi:hypothetical protein JOE56_000382 [Brevibacterium paucivorans]|uniref:XRE family transcriptional regulator n=1 Tax=Brevibacterium paucivorans TaxID=170994 RepID=A0ABS2SHG0_9MICO|nr:XRE family transcriptional regulator [Brevibacterium paucivorans]MBM7815688.1 hypothetical protein [Brevibacterium paucivorans]